MEKNFLFKVVRLSIRSIVFLFFLSISLFSRDISDIELPINGYGINDLKKDNNTKLYRNALSLYADEKYIEALFEFGRLIQQKSENIQNDGVFYFIASSFENMGMYEQAIDNYKKLIREHPKSKVIPFADLGIVRAAYKNNSLILDDILNKINDELWSDSLKLHVIYYVGEYKLKTNMVDEAIALFREIPKEHFMYHFAQYSLAVALYRKNGDKSEVYTALKNVLMKEPISDSEKEICNKTNLSLGFLYYEDKEMPIALSTLKNVPENSIYFEYVLLGRSWAALKSKQWIDCISSSQKLREITKNELLRAESKLLEAYCYMMDKKWSQAEELLKSAQNDLLKLKLEDYDHLQNLINKLNDENLKVALTIDSLITKIDSEYKKDAIKEIGVKQREIKANLDYLSQQYNMLNNDMYICRKKEEIQRDVDYALAKNQKTIGLKIDAKEMRKSVEMVENVDDEMLKLQEELRKLEAGESSSSSAKVKKSSRSDHVYEESLDYYSDLVGGEVKDKAKKRFSDLANKSMLKAGSHDDNEEFTYYQKYCKDYRFPGLKSWNINERFIIKCVDSENNTIPFAKVDVYHKKSSKILFSARTMANGEIVLFPYMDLGNNYSDIKNYYAKVNGGDGFAFKKDVESLILLKQETTRILPKKIPIQVTFLLDATGSMKDEINELKDVIFSIHHRITSNVIKPEISFATVAYRDITDNYHYKKFDFTNDIDQFQINLENIKAGGGGDYPEDLDKGLEVTLDQLSWKKDALKFVFLIGDAPPHLDYGREKDYIWGMKKAREEGIMICPIGASGLKPIGEFIFRQIGVITNGEFIFLHYGEMGESSGGSTFSDRGKVSHHTGSNYNVKKLDDIVVNIINTELGYITEETKITYTVPEVKTESDFLDTRLENLLGQMFDNKVSEKLKDRKVIISPFSFKDSLFAPISDYLWETSIEKITSLTPLQVIERQKIEEILKEHSLDMSGLTETEGDSNIGKMFSSDYIIFSSLKFLGSIRVCHMRLVDCKNGEVLSAARVKL